MNTDYTIGARARLLATIGGSVAALLGSASPALAQDSETAAANNDDVIIVTAQRRAEALEDVPMTVTVLTSETLEASGVNSMRDLNNVVTGFQLAQGGSFPQPAIRGVTTLLNGTFENNVAVYVDGFYQPAAQAIAIDLPNVESLQVLKGPQGTLYGRNATGGAILLHTITPGDTWQGKAELTYARYDDKRASGYVSGPLSDQFAISVAGYTRRGDGYAKLASRTVPGETDGNAAPIKQDSVRIKFKADLTDSFRAIAGYNYTFIIDGRAGLLSAFENVALAQAPARATLPQRLGVAAWDIENTVNAKQHDATLTLELDTGIGMLKSYSGWSQFKVRNSFDFDGSYLNGIWSTSVMRERTFQQALDYQIDAIQGLDLIVGASYLHDKLTFTEPSVFYQGAANNSGATEVPLSRYALLFSSYFDQKKEAWAAYLDATFHATDALSINVGGRYSKEQQDVSGSQTSFVPALVRAQNDKSASFSKFTPRVSIRYEIAPRTNIYATYSKGFRSGAFVSQLPAVPSDWVPAKQESVDAFEIGVKSAAGPFRFEAAGFYYDYSDFQVSATLSGASGQPVTLITNAPKAKIKGVEASFDFEPFENFTIRGGATYLHARYGKGFIFTGLAVNPAVAGVNMNSDPLKTYVNVNQNQDLSGMQMSRAPDLTATLGMDYLIPQGDGGLRLAANLKYTDSYVATNPSIWCDPEASNGAICAGIPADRQRQQRFRQGSYVLLNASVTWTDPSDSYYVRVWGNNITDHRYRLHYTGNATWGSYSPMAEPLTYGVTIGYKL
jgi:iron complex outermembrane recepter protein